MKEFKLHPAEPFTVSEKSVANLSRAIQFQTVSYEDENSKGFEALNGFINFLNESYPLMNSGLQREKITEYALLYKWNGKNSSAKPIVLMSHGDVVPVEEETMKLWEVDPFSGREKNGFIYGRGTLDNKSSLIGICEAVEKLLSENFTPEKNIYIAFGFDEELGGNNGAAKISEYLKAKNITAEFVLDEGLAITDGIIPGMEKPVALIGIAEKGHCSLELSVNFSGGHSSMPEKENAITILSSAIDKLQKNPFPVRLSEPTELFLKAIGAEMPFAKKFIFTNLWLFKSIVMNVFQKFSSGNATLRTTISPTIFHSGIKMNLIPTEAKAVINFRTLPGETSKIVQEFVIKIINDQRVTIRTVGIVNEASPVSSVCSEGFKAIKKTIFALFPNMVVAPSLVLATTDSRHFIPVSENIYRFLPIRLKPEDLKRFHGINERISVGNFKECIRFYYYLLKNVARQSAARLSELRPLSQAAHPHNF